jgi:aldehyde:ferredoxin oxidoreductase
MTEVFAEFGSSPEAIEVIEKITGDKKWASPHFTDYRAEIVRWHEDCYEITEALGFCVFTSTAAYGVNPDNMARLYTAATGIPMTEEEIMLTGRRVCTIEKAFNVTRGATREHDNLPWRLMNEGAASGPLKGETNSQEELDGMLDRYYELHEWDKKTSWPTRETLEKLELKDVAEYLEKIGKLP